MANLLLGPILRFVARTEATVWVQTDVPCTVEILGRREPTFQVDGHHYALVCLGGLSPGTAVEYTVQLDGRRAWPEPGRDLPPSTLRTIGDDGQVRMVFGSCRVSLPHQPPFVLDQSDDPQGQGIDALRSLALRAAGAPPAEQPDLLLMLGDQIYADDLSPRMRAVTESRARPADAPPDELADFAEYACAYREAWGEPAIRWLLSTVPTAMIFDDHEIHAEWKISQARVERMRRNPWYEQRISAGLAAYWIYQHLGNLSPQELAGSALYERLRAAEDGGALLREEMRNADRQPGHSRWSFSRDLGGARLVAIDSRAGRQLAPQRLMIDEGEWEWVADQISGNVEHLLLASSVPFFLSAGLHHAEACDEAVAAGAWGRRAAGLGERVRQAAVMDHWASFQRSFCRLGDLLESVAAGRRGRAPTSIVMLSGDVHHAYLAEVGFRAAAGARSAVWQAVCSGYRKRLAPRERMAMRIGNSRAAAVIARALARAAGVADPPVGWRISRGPSYGNLVATLHLAPGRGSLRLETVARSDWRDPRLRTVFEHSLVGR